MEKRDPSIPIYMNWAYINKSFDKYTTNPEHIANFFYYLYMGNFLCGNYVPWEDLF